MLLLLTSSSALSYFGVPTAAAVFGARSRSACMLDVAVGDKVRVTGTDDYPKFFHVPGHKAEAFVARGMIGTVDRVYVEGECDHLDRSDERDIYIVFDEPKKWKAHFAADELEICGAECELEAVQSAAPGVGYELLADTLCETDVKGCDKVEDFMKPASEALVLAPEMGLLDAAKLLNENSITGAPVCIDGRLVGVLTQFDFLYQEGVALNDNVGSKVKLSSGSWASVVKKSLASTVSAAMSKPTAIAPESDMKLVAQLMLRKRFNHVPVVSADGTLLGILTSQDVLRHVILTMSPDV